MGDDELAAIRNRRMAELQAQMVKLFNILIFINLNFINGHGHKWTTLAKKSPTLASPRKKTPKISFERL